MSTPCLKGSVLLCFNVIFMTPGFAGSSMAASSRLRWHAASYACLDVHVNYPHLRNPKKPSVHAAHSIATSWSLALGSHSSLSLRRISGVMGKRDFAGEGLWCACWRLRPLRTQSSLDRSAFLNGSLNP